MDSFQRFVFEDISEEYELIMGGRARVGILLCVILPLGVEAVGTCQRCLACCP